MNSTCSQCVEDFSSCVRSTSIFLGYVDIQQNLQPLSVTLTTISVIATVHQMISPQLSQKYHRLWQILPILHPVCVWDNHPHLKWPLQFIGKIMSFTILFRSHGVKFIHYHPSFRSTSVSADTVCRENTPPKREHNTPSKSSSFSSTTPSQFSSSPEFWTCYRLEVWLREIELPEYVSGLRNSGLHGALLVRDGR